jgi:hypothetical protein
MWLSEFGVGTEDYRKAALVAGFAGTIIIGSVASVGPILLHDLTFCTCVRPEHALARSLVFQRHRGLPA